ncbi:hypothetical protein SAMN04487911_1267 [Arenibacter nanhaiticus]|uniref:Uncharacterized protein n=1 Tax=Arenibacter nanhaiticus TaxID=558155 RepID=A0A1M6KHX3_9FLAO|nr:hypothetical protein SAMN04487911_1267 [Arenibacter nanhaiticus]
MKYLLTNSSKNYTMALNTKLLGVFILLSISTFAIYFSPMEKWNTEKHKIITEKLTA